MSHFFLAALKFKLENIRPTGSAAALLAPLAFAGLCLLSTGCSQSATGSSADVRARPSAEQVLDDMVKAYRAAPAYADSGELHMQFDLPGNQRVDERADFAVSFVRPNKLRLHCYQAIVVSDGKLMHATIADLDKQVLEQPAPETLSLETIYTDEALRQALTQQIAGSSPQLALLLGDDFLNAALQGGEKPELLKTETIDDEPCDIIRVKRDDGELTLAIGQKTHTLRRIEFPTQELAQHLEQQLGEPVRGLRLWADLRGARIGGKVDDVAFQFQTPDDAKLVPEFDLRSLMPAPPEPSKLLGQKMGEFTFTKLDGSSVTRESLEGKIAVIDFWATWCAPCLQSLPNLNQVYEKYKDNDRIEFVAVSIDQPEVTTQQIERAFQQIGVGIPIARDSMQTSLAAFQVEGIPNMFILGPDGTVEDNEVGMNPELADELPDRLEKLLAGQSLHTEAQARYEERKAQYEAAMNAPAPSSQAGGAGQVRAAIAPQAAPLHHTLDLLWANSDAKQPGNILVVESSDGTPRLLVNDGWQRVIELDSQGRLVAEHTLQIDPMCVVSYLRSAVDTAGRRWYLGAASTQKQLHLFDESFQTMLSYPPEEAEVADALFTDTDGDGNPEIAVGYWGTRGVESLNLLGVTRWKSGALDNVFRLATGVLQRGEKPLLLAAHGRGSIAVYDAQGQAANEIAVDKRFLRAIYAADLNRDGLAELCALAPVDEGRDVLLGINADGQEQWHYDLPAGIHEQPIEQVTAGHIDGQACWIACAADGSIHFVGVDGKLLDRLSYGEQLTGVASAQLDGQPALLVASTRGISAYRLAPKQN